MLPILQYLWGLKGNFYDQESLAYTIKTIQFIFFILYKHKNEIQEQEHVLSSCFN